MNTKTDTPETDAQERIGYTYKTLLDHARSLERERDAALREITALRKDKERLDWLESKDAHVNHAYGLTGHSWVVEAASDIEHYGDTLRQAIDLAKEAQ